MLQDQEIPNEPTQATELNESNETKEAHELKETKEESEPKKTKEAAESGELSKPAEPKEEGEEEGEEKGESKVVLEPYMTPLARFQKESGRIVTSSVFEHGATWKEKAFLVPHEPFRQELIIAADAMQRVNLAGEVPQSWKISHFFIWWKRYASALHHHHEVEEKILFPTLTERMEVPPKMTADHSEIMEQINNISAMQTEFKSKVAKNPKSAEGEDFGKRLGDMVQHFRDTLLPHLAEEEQLMESVVNHFTEDEFAEIEQRIVKDAGPKGVVLLPMILDAMEKWAGAEEAKRFKKDNLPGFIAFLLRKFWWPAHLRIHVNALKRMHSEEPPVPRSSCVIM